MEENNQNNQIFEIGDKVVITPTSTYFKSQGMHGTGVVSYIDTELFMGSMSVTFSDGYNNSYYNKDLAKATDTNNQLDATKVSYKLIKEKK